MGDWDRDLDDVPANAHLPALLASLVHLTGDASWLRQEWFPTYVVPLSRGDPGLPPEVKDDIRAQAWAALAKYLAEPRLAMPALDVATLRRMMDFVAGAPIPEGYVDFLMDELAITGTSSKDPQFEQPQLMAAARKLKVVVIGAGMSGLLTAIRLLQAGVPFEVIESNPDVGGTWLVNTYPGCRVDNPNHWSRSASPRPSRGWPRRRAR
jgi:4-hydroxyacetophenone monooxygenase